MFQVVYIAVDLDLNLQFLKIMKMYCLSFCFYCKDKRGIVDQMVAILKLSTLLFALATIVLDRIGTIDVTNMFITNRPF